MDNNDNKDNKDNNNNNNDSRKKSKSSLVFEGKVIAFSGWRPKTNGHVEKQMKRKKMIVDNDIEINHTDYLIIQGNGSREKQKKAKEFGIPIIPLEQFIRENQFGEFLEIDQKDSDNNNNNNNNNNNDDDDDEKKPSSSSRSGSTSTPPSKKSRR